MKKGILEMEPIKIGLLNRGGVFSWEVFYELFMSLTFRWDLCNRSWF